MAFIADYVLDAALFKITTDANRLDITSQEASSYVEATKTYSLGNKAQIQVSNPSDRATNGRHVTIAAISDGLITSTGKARHWALTDTMNARLLATGYLSEPQSVTSGNTFTMGSISIGIPDAV